MFPPTPTTIVQCFVCVNCGGRASERKKDRKHQTWCGSGWSKRTSRMETHTYTRTARKNVQTNVFLPFDSCTETDKENKAEPTTTKRERKRYDWQSEGRGYDGWTKQAIVRDSFSISSEETLCTDARTSIKEIEKKKKKKWEKHFG